MRIAIDLRWIRSENIDGISRYAIHLVSHLLKRDSENQYVLLGDEARLKRHTNFPAFPNAATTAIPPPLLSVQDFLLTQQEIQRLHVDIFHAPNYLCSPLSGSYKKILTVQDLIPFLFPKALSKSRILWRWFYKTVYPARIILRSADTIITTSENTKQDIMHLLKIPSERIQVLWIGVEERFHPNYPIPNAFLQKYQLPQRFMLYVGRQDPYKGLRYLVQAYDLLPEALKEEYQVVIAGKTDLRYIGEIHTLINELHLQQSFVFLDYVPDEELPLLYSAATLLVHPSLYEGFGLTPLEAMACGTQVVYADTSSLSELIGDAGYAVSPASAQALADGIEQLLQNTQLRQTFSTQGTIHIQRYSWQNIADEMLRIYQDLGK